MAVAGGSARFVLLFVGLVLIIAGLVGAVTNGFRICGTTGCGSGQTYYGNLVGYVTDQATGLGVPSASVKLSVSGVQKYAAATDGSGYFQFLAIVDGGYAVTVTHAGYTTFSGSTSLGPTLATWTYNVQLAASGSGGTGGAEGCANPFSCNVPPPPPGVVPPPPPPGPTNTTNGTTTGPVPFSPSPASVMLVLFGSFLVVIAAAWRA